jgi:cobalt-zinc-cadmium efflux system membrane fusion protein
MTVKIIMKKIFIVLAIAALAACGDDHSHSAQDAKHSHQHGDEHNEGAAHDKPEQGPHRGRLLRDGDFALEVAIYETGVEPEFHVYATQSGKTIKPSDVKLNIELARLDGRIDRFAFNPENDYLKGDAVVAEPHSFDVAVTAEYAGRQHRWSYAAYEGRTTIAPEMAKSAGIKTAIAAPGAIRETLALYGTIQPNAERVRNVVARFPGPIRSVAKQIGDRVKAGETLATIESNESLQIYAVTAPIAGVITQRHANPGEVADNDPLFVIADFDSVWAELTVFIRDRAKIRAGQRVHISATDAKENGEGDIAFVAPASTGAQQSFVARVPLPNTDARWTPGLFVAATVTIGETQAPLVVANSALQPFRDFTVVFAQVGATYEVRMLELGRTDGSVTEVLGGLQPGTVYVTDNSYLVKADIEKSGASHDH